MHTSVSFSEAYFCQVSNILFLMHSFFFLKNICNFFRSFIPIKWLQTGRDQQRPQVDDLHWLLNHYWTTSNLRLLPFQVLSTRNNLDFGSSSLLKSTRRFQVKSEVGSNSAISNHMDLGTINEFLWKTISGFPLQNYRLSSYGLKYKSKN